MEIATGLDAGSLGPEGAGPPIRGYEKRSCPICHSPNDAGNAEVRTRIAAEDLPFDAIRADWSGFFKEKRIFSYYRCHVCGLLYAPSYFSLSQLRELYSDMADNTAGVDYSAIDKTQSGYAHGLAGHLRQPGGELLEIGPDIGQFTRHAIRLGGFTKCWLFEPNVAVHDRLAENVKPTEHEISTELTNLEGVPDGQISAAAMIHVLDHLSDPMDLLRQVRRKLKPGGVLAVVVHDERSTLPRVIGERCPIYCLQHPHLFNRQTLRRILADCGFDDIVIRSSVNYFPVFYLVEHAAFAVGLRRPHLPRADRFQIPVKLGNMIAVARATVNSGGIIR
jgi:SAM-dependent methyltransferase